MNSDSLPIISVIIPVKPDGYVKALLALKEIDYPPDRLEILIAEGTQPSRQRNEAAREASGEILYFLDDDSSPDRSNMQLMIAHYRDVSVAGVGGPSITPETDSFMQKCFGALLCSSFGGAAIKNRYQRKGMARESDESELILCNLSFRADLYKKLGGLNEDLYPNEENELMSRIQSLGLKLIHDPDIYVLRSQREGLKSFARQMFNYGRGRMEQTIITPASASLMHFIPAAFVLYLVCLALIPVPYFAIPLLLYALLSAISSLAVAICAKKNLFESAKIFIVVFLLYPLMHIGYAVGTFYGLRKLPGKADKKASDKINIINVDLSSKGK